MYLHEVGGPEEIHHPTVQPLSKKLLEKIRQRLHVEWLMDMTLGDIVLYMFYVGVVMFMVHGHRNIKLVYRNNLAIEDVLVNPGCIKLHKCFFLAKVIVFFPFYYCPLPFRRKAEGHCFWLSVVHGSWRVVRGTWRVVRGSEFLVGTLSP